MAEELSPQKKEQDKLQQRPNIVGKKPLDYSKWEDLDFESDEDDCHPNIEIGTWRRLKERMRKEKGIVKKEPHLVDKWNVTTTNKNYAIDPTKPPKTISEQKLDQTDTIAIDSPENTSTTDTTDTTQSHKENKNNDSTTTPPIQTENNNQPSEPSKPPTTIVNGSKQAKAKAEAEPKKPQTQTQEEEDYEPYKARSNPQTFLDEHLDKLKKFATTKKDSKADKFVKKHPYLVHEAAEGYLVTYAVDRAVEGAEKPELARLSRRCLQIHNLVQSCSQQNVSPQIGVARFFNKIGQNNKLTESYQTELNKQVKELMERIEVRRVERLQELQDRDIPNQDEYDEDDEDEKAPPGPGGLDPTDVLNSLPKEMQDAFVSQDIESLKMCLNDMDKDMAEYHMRRCIDAGLWVQPEEDVNVSVDGGPD